MIISEFDQIYEINNLSELETILRRRDKYGMNEFWLSHDDNEYPLLGISINQELAIVHYFPKEKDAGSHALSKVEGLDTRENTEFLMGDVKLEMPNDMVILFTSALEVAKQFFGSDNRPTYIEWFDL